MRTAKIVLSLIAGVALTAGCTETQKGAGVGAGVGAGIGAIVGHQSHDTGEGAAIGAAVGGITGAVVGNERQKRMDAEEELRRQRYESKRDPYDQGSYHEEPLDQPSYDEDYNQRYGETDAPAEDPHQGRQWIEGHYETRTVTGPDGRTYDREVWVPGHYE